MSASHLLLGVGPRIHPPSLLLKILGDHIFDEDRSDNGRIKTLFIGPDVGYQCAYWIKIIQRETFYFLSVGAQALKHYPFTQMSPLQTCGNQRQYGVALWDGKIRTHQPTGIVVVHLAKLILQVLSHMLLPLDNAVMISNIYHCRNTRPSLVQN